jgi:N-acyl-D-amino-acid deacylase
MYDLVIRHGRIVSGAGNPWFYGDLAVAKGKIVKIGRLAGEQAAKTIDANGLMIAPGFIDGHSHSDLFIFADPNAPQKVRQGVTTENLGMDGMSAAPIDEENVSDWRKYLSGLAGDPKIPWNWRSFAEYFDEIDRLPPSLNIVSYVGLGTIRLKVMGMSDRPADPAQIEQMKTIAGRAMEEGARGVSAGLIYPPSQYQSTEEMIEIAKVVREYDGIFDVHMRSESDRILESIDEVLQIGEQSGIPILITHFKIRGRKNWGGSDKALEKLDRARQKGIDVTIAQYPYTAGSTMLQAVIPPWYHTKGPRQLVRALQTEREAVRRDLYERSDWENIALSLGWDNIVVSSVESASNKAYEGMSIEKIASLRGLEDPADAAFDLLVEEELAVGMIIFGLHEDDVMCIMKHPTVSFITDGLLGGGRPHPRVYGTYPRILGHYVREEGVLTIEEAIRKMTTLPAEKLRLRTKGVIAEDYDADIAIFDPESIIDRGTYESPTQFPDGVKTVIVNGQVVVEDGEHTGARPGKTIRIR